MHRRDEGSCVLAPSRVGAFGALGGRVEKCKLDTQRPVTAALPVWSGALADHPFLFATRHEGGTFPSATFSVVPFVTWSAFS